MRTKTVCILSGGMDSTTLLYKLIAEGKDAVALSFDYGQRHKKELDFAKRTCDKLKIQHIVVDLSSFGELLTNCALTNLTHDIPEGEYNAENIKLTVVPHRNMIMLTLAASYAETIGAESVAIAVHGGDHALYADCRNSFIKACQAALQEGSYEPIEIYAPYVDLTKTDIARDGLALGIDYSETWSCYKGGDKPCGVCATCLEREEALEKASH